MIKIIQKFQRGENILNNIEDLLILPKKMDEHEIKYSDKRVCCRD